MAKPAKIAKSTNVEYRVRFLRDTDARFEECNGEARPLTEAEYLKEGQYMACPVHPHGDKSNDRRQGGKAWCGQTLHVGAGKVCGREYAPVPYADYLAYYGNKDRHRYIGVVVETQDNVCTHCGRGDGWQTTPGLWNIDLMDDGVEWLFIRRRLNEPIRAALVSSLPGYLAVVAKEQLEEAGYIA